MNVVFFLKKKFLYRKFYASKRKEHTTIIGKLFGLSGYGRNLVYCCVVSPTFTSTTQIIFLAKFNSTAKKLLVKTYGNTFFIEGNLKNSFVESV